MAKQILDNKFGYGADQFSCFDWIIKHESGWNVHAQNASSGAYGLPQSLPGSKMASVASDWRAQPGDPDHLGCRVHEEPVRQPVRRQVVLGGSRELLSRRARTVSLRASPRGRTFATATSCLPLWHG